MLLFRSHRSFTRYLGCSVGAAGDPGRWVRYGGGQRQGWVVGPPRTSTRACACAWAPDRSAPGTGGENGWRLRPAPACGAPRRPGARPGVGPPGATGRAAARPQHAIPAGVVRSLARRYPFRLRLRRYPARGLPHRNRMRPARARACPTPCAAAPRPHAKPFYRVRPVGAPAGAYACYGSLQPALARTHPTGPAPPRAPALTRLRSNSGPPWPRSREQAVESPRLVAAELLRADPCG